MRKKGLTVITGSSSGIGRALAEAFIAGGYRVAATARSLKDIRGFERRCALTAELDVSKKQSVNAFAHRLAKNGEKVSILINNAGYASIGPIAEMPRTELSAQFETNVVGAVDMVRALLPLMDQETVVINIGSISGEVTTPWAGAYCASKAALHVLSDALRMELAPFGIQIMTVKPGGIVSRFGSRASASAKKSIPAGAKYKPFEKGILSRALESQSKAARAEDLAIALVRAVQRRSVPRTLRFGPKSLSLLLLKFLLPVTLFDGMKMKRYGLK